MKRLIITVVFLLFSFLLPSCAKWSVGDDAEDAFKGMSENTLYQYANEALNKGDHNAAIKRFEAVENNFPFSTKVPFAQRALIYTYYVKGDFALSAAVADRYIRLYPREKHTDYAYYMKAMANFEQTRGTFAKIFPIDASWRDPGTQGLAYENFVHLVQRFPDSRYKDDALQHMIYLRNMFARKQLNIANYYLNRKEYVAAINRANFVVQHFAQSPQAKTALKVLYKANKGLNLASGTYDAIIAKKQNNA